MESTESVFVLVLVLTLGLGFVVALIAFILTGFDWWDKL